MKGYPMANRKFGFIDSLSDGVIVLGCNKIVDINKTMLSFLKGNRENYIGCNFEKYFSTPESMDSITESINGYEDKKFSGKIIDLEFNIEFNVSRFDEETFVLVASRLHNEYNSENLFRWILGVSVEGIIIHDENEKVIYANNAMSKILGEEDPENLIGKKLLDITAFHPDYVDEIYKRREDLFNDDTVLPYLEQKIIKNDGIELTIEVSALSYTENGEKRIVLIIRDITEKRKSEEDRRKLEETLEYDRLRTEFFSNISHELRTPLNIILVTLQLIDSQHGKLGRCTYYENYDDYFKMMRQNCYRLLRLINNIIDITRLDAGFFNINSVNSDIISTVEDIVMSVADYTKSQDISIIFDTEVEEKFMAFDPDKLERVILNLLSNAIKFNKSGGSIFVNIYDKGESIVISVKDTGIGIPDNMREKVFEKFTQVDNLFTRTAEGSGIGLSLTKSLVEAHGGNISVESTIGEGSNFIVELPVRFVENDYTINSSQLENQDKIERINIEFSDIYSFN